SAGAFGATSSLEDVAVRPRGTQPSPHASGAAGFFEDMSVGCQGSQPSPVASGAAGSREDMSIGCQGSQPSPVASGAAGCLEDMSVGREGSQPSPVASGAAGFLEDMSVGREGSQPSPAPSGAAGFLEDMPVGREGSQPSPHASGAAGFLEESLVQRQSSQPAPGAPRDAGFRAEMREDLGSQPAQGDDGSAALPERGSAVSHGRLAESAVVYQLPAVAEPSPATGGAVGQGNAAPGVAAQVADRLQAAESVQLSYVVAPCRRVLPRKEPGEVAELLRRLALERFQAKQAVFEGELAVFEPEQALYAGLMEALGYSRNRAPFRQLALQLPLAGLRVLRTASRIEAALLAAAGLGGDMQALVE